MDKENVDLKSYEWIVINSSAGKDSQAMLTDMVRRCDAAGVERAKMVVAHADLGDMEWKSTKDLAETQAKFYGLRFEAVARPQGDLLTQIEQRGMWPSSSCRYCTSDHKRGQVSKIITKLSKETKKDRPGMIGPVRILNCLGIRAQESPARAKKIPFQTNERLTGKAIAKYVDEYYPIFDWTVGQVWETIKNSGVQHHYAYDLGMPRLSCIFCVFAPKAALITAGKHNPEMLDRYVQVEKKIGHTFRHKFSIKEVQDAIAQGETGVEGLSDQEVQCWNM